MASVLLESIRTPRRESSGRRHSSTPPARLLKCEECGKTFVQQKTYQDHLRTHEPEVEPTPLEETKLPLPDSWYEDNLVLASQAPDVVGDFIVDSLYLGKDGALVCFTSRGRCFVTRRAEEMRDHREKVHPLLELRFSADVWMKNLPETFASCKEDCFNNNHDNNNAEMRKRRRKQMIESLIAN